MIGGDRPVAGRAAHQHRQERGVDEEEGADGAQEVGGQPEQVADRAAGDEVGDAVGAARDRVEPSAKRMVGRPGPLKR